jgi:hypothetical protein
MFPWRSKLISDVTSLQVFVQPAADWRVGAESRGLDFRSYLSEQALQEIARIAPALLHSHAAAMSQDHGDVLDILARDMVDGDEDGGENEDGEADDRDELGSDAGPN